MAKIDEICRAFDLELDEHGIRMPPPRYNIAPSQPIAVVFDDSPRRLSDGAWGFVVKKNEQTQLILQARVEGANERPLFRDAMRARRCIVPASGFFEWQRQGKGKVPHYVRPKSGELVGFAGLWRQERDGRHVVMLTTAANQDVSAIHDRMPVIFDRAAAKRWLTSMEIGPTPALLANETSDYVNSTAHEGPDCHAPPTALRLPF